MPTPLDCGSQEQRNYCCFQPPGTAAPGHSHGLQIWNLILQIPQMLAVILSPLFLPHRTPVCQQLLFARPSAGAYLPPGSRRCPLLVPLSSPRGRWLFPWSWDEGLGSCSSPPPQRWQLSPAQTSGPSKTSLLPDLRGHTVPPVLWGLPRELPRSGHPLCPFCPARADGGPWDGDSGPSLCG